MQSCSTGKYRLSFTVSQPSEPLNQPVRHGSVDIRQCSNIQTAAPQLHMFQIGAARKVSVVGSTPPKGQLTNFAHNGWVAVSLHCSRHRIQFRALDLSFRLCPPWCFTLPIPRQNTRVWFIERSWRRLQSRKALNEQRLPMQPMKKVCSISRCAFSTACPLTKKLVQGSRGLRQEVSSPSTAYAALTYTTFDILLFASPWYDAINEVSVFDNYRSRDAVLKPMNTSSPFKSGLRRTRSWISTSITWAWTKSRHEWNSSPHTRTTCASWNISNRCQPCGDPLALFIPWEDLPSLVDDVMDICDDGCNACCNGSTHTSLHVLWYGREHVRDYARNVELLRKLKEDGAPDEYQGRHAPSPSPTNQETLERGWHCYRGYSVWPCSGHQLSIFSHECSFTPIVSHPVKPWHMACSSHTDLVFPKP